MPPRGVAPEVVAELHRRYLAGETVPDLAAETGRTTGWFYWAFTKAGLRRLPAGKRILTVDHPRAREAIALWDSGVGSRKAAKQMHMGNDTLRRLLTESGRDPMSRARGNGHHNWKGGRLSHIAGYVLVQIPPDSPFLSMASTKRYVMEHRLRMAAHLGRPLRPDETVHHRNGVRDDNRLENLQLRSAAHGQGAVMRCADCGSTNLEPQGLDGST